MAGARVGAGAMIRNWAGGWDYEKSRGWDYDQGLGLGLKLGLEKGLGPGLGLGQRQGLRIILRLGLWVGLGLGLERECGWGWDLDCDCWKKHFPVHLFQRAESGAPRAEFAAEPHQGRYLRARHEARQHRGRPGLRNAQAYGHEPLWQVRTCVRACV